MTPPQLLTPTWIGCAAMERLRGARKAHVLGTISRGAFVKLDQGSLIFLSSERWRGPLTINFDWLPQLVGNYSGSVMDKWLRLGAVEIGLDGAPVWQPDPRPAVRLNAYQTWERLNEISRCLLHSPTAGAFCLLPAALSWEAGSQADGQALQAAREALREGEVELLVQALKPFAGRGPGLTPAGDDLLAGLLLALNRWGDVAVPGFPVAALNDRLQAAAGRRISALSAALLECAAHGQADERLIAALDSLFSGEPAPSAAAARLAGWGSSSGGEALAGMSLMLPHNPNIG